MATEVYRVGLGLSDEIDWYFSESGYPSLSELRSTMAQTIDDIIEQQWQEIEKISDEINLLQIRRKVIEKYVRFLYERREEMNKDTIHALYDGEDQI